MQTRTTLAAATVVAVGACRALVAAALDKFVAPLIRCADRNPYAPIYRSSESGFRVGRTLR
jgi:hypothetical protein